MARFDPARPDFSPYGFSCVRWTPTTMPRGDRHNEIELNLLEEGRLVYLMGGRKVVVPAGRLAAFWAGVSHQIVGFERLSEYFVLTIPLAWFLQWRLPDHFTQTILHGGTIVEPDEGRLASDRASFESWSEDLRIGSEERRQVCLLEVEARLRRLAMSVAADGTRRPRRNSPAVLDHRHLSRAEQMASFIAQNYTQPLTAEDIGQHVGLHPNYAMALFQRTFGTTLIRPHHPAPALARSAAARDHEGLRREHRVRLGLRLAQPFQRGVPPVLRLHATGIPQVAPIDVMIVRQCKRPGLTRPCMRQPGAPAIDKEDTKACSSQTANDDGGKPGVKFLARSKRRRVSGPRRSSVERGEEGDGLWTFGRRRLRKEKLFMSPPRRRQVGCLTPFVIMHHTQSTACGGAIVDRRLL